MNATIIFEQKAEVQDQYPLSLNPDQKANDPIQDRNRSIGPMLFSSAHLVSKSSIDKNTCSRSKSVFRFLKELNRCITKKL